MSILCLYYNLYRSNIVRLTMVNLNFKKTHDYYYQIQGKLHITQSDMCYFIIYTPQWLLVQEIHYDPDFWLTNMVDKLKT